MRPESSRGDAQAGAIVQNAPSLKDFGTIETLTVSEDYVFHSAFTVRLDLTLRPPAVSDQRRLFLSFFGVRELRVAQPSESTIDIALLEIDLLPKDQLEGSKYRVHEEDGVLSFFCLEFTVREGSAVDE